MGSQHVALELSPQPFLQPSLQESPVFIPSPLLLAAPAPDSLLGDLPPIPYSPDFQSTLDAFQLFTLVSECLLDSLLMALPGLHLDY